MSTSAASVVAARSVPAGRGWQWIVDAWVITAGYRALFVGLSVGVIVLAGIVDVLPIVGAFVAAVLTPALIAGLVMGTDSLRRGEPLTVEHLFSGFKQQTRSLLALGATLAVANVVFAALAEWLVPPGNIDGLIQTLPNVILGGAVPDLLALQDVLLRSMLEMLIVLALSVPLFMALWFAVPLVALNGVGAVSAMKLSFVACAENSMPFLVWSVPPLVLTLVIMVPFSIAIAARSLLLGILSIPLLLLDFLLLIALTFVSIYTSYRDIFALGE